MGSIVALVSRHERPLVRAQAGRLHRVAARQGVARRLRWRVCVQVAAIAPQLTFDQLSPLMRHALWSYRLDNRLDASGIDLATAARVRDGVAAVTTGAEVRLADPLLVELASIISGLLRYDRTGTAVRWYGDALRDTLDAEVDQLRGRLGVAGSRPAPTAEQYLATAEQTVNYRSFAYALLAATGDPLTGRQLRCLDGALRPAARAVRLANDVRSLARDDSAGVLNVLHLPTATGEAMTADQVWDEVDRNVAAHDAALRALAGLGVVPPAAARALGRALDQSIRLYRNTDLR